MLLKADSVAQYKAPQMDAILNSSGTPSEIPNQKKELSTSSTSSTPNTRKRRKTDIAADSVTETLTSVMADNVEELEQNLDALYNKSEHSTKDIISAIMGAQKITNAKLKPLSDVIKQANENTKKILSVEAKVTRLDKAHNSLSDKVAVLEQEKFDSQATITGFKSPPEEAPLKSKLCELFDLEPADIVSVRSFTVIRKEPQPLQMVITNIYFTNPQVKGKLITAKIARGIMKAKAFLPSLKTEQGAENTIYIGHKLTNTNLRIRKVLINLQKANQISSKRFRNNRFQIQLPGSELWKDVTTLKIIDQLIPGNTFSSQPAARMECDN